MQLNLIIETGVHQSLVFSRDKAGKYWIGRAADADLALIQYERISRKHCVLDVRSGGVWVRDNESRNGIYVNSQRVCSVGVAQVYQLRHCSDAPSWSRVL